MSLNKLLVFALLGVLIPLECLAHGASIWAEVKDGEVIIEAHYSNGNRVQNAKILVKDNYGKELLTGVTNLQGSFSFPTPQNVEKIKIELHLDESHRDSIELNKDQLRSTVDTIKPSHQHRHSSKVNNDH